MADIKNIMVYCLAKDKIEAKNIARKLVEKRLAACVNLVDSIESIYHWQGKICEESETLMLIKSQKSLFEELNKTIQKMHSYDVPEVVAVDMVQGDEKYFKWLDKETK